MHDEELTNLLAEDLDGSFERLVLTYQDRLYGFALRLTGSPRDAEEIAQDAFVRAYRALAQYPAERVRALTPRPWLYQITRNVVLNRVRGRRLRLVSLDGPEDGGRVDPQDDEAGRPESMLERLEQRDQLGALVAGLPERYRAAVVLRHVEGLGYDEVAAVLDQPVGTVKANVHRGIRLLREALEARRLDERQLEERWTDGQRVDERRPGMDERRVDGQRIGRRPDGQRIERRSDEQQIGRRPDGQRTERRLDRRAPVGRGPRRAGG